MSQQLIDIGQAANDKTGDPLRDAMDKINQNFTELFAPGLKFKKVVITEEQFSNCFTVPIACIDNPGPNKFNMVHQQMLRWQPGAAPWSNETLVLKTGNVTHRNYGSFGSASENFQNGTAASQAFGTPINQPTILAAVANNPSGGSGGTLTLYVWYSVVDA